MIFSDVQDAFLNTRNLTEYAYDAFGRRIETIEYLGDSTRNLYDGFSFDVVGKTLLQTRSAPAMTEQKYRAGSAGHPELGSGSAAGRSGAGVANGTRYRYIGDEPLVPLEQAGSAAGGTTGGGSTNTINTNSKTVTFGHGGRHLEGTNLSVSEVEKQIAKDISKKNLSPGSQQSQKISINGIGIEYRPYVKEDGTINIGTYFTVGE